MRERTAWPYISDNSDSRNTTHTNRTHASLFDEINMFKTVLAVALLLVVKVLASPLHSRPTSLYEDQRMIRQEAACAVQGGMCRERVECSPGDTVRVADLCPLQSHMGIVCCYYH